MKILTGITLALILVSASIIKTRPQVLVFTAEWCEPCRELHNAIDKKEKEGYRKVKFRYVNFDTEKDLVKRFNITSIPTTVYKKKRKVGFSTSDNFFDWIKNNVEGK